MYVTVFNRVSFNFIYKHRVSQKSQSTLLFQKQKEVWNILEPHHGLCLGSFWNRFDRYILIWKICRTIWCLQYVVTVAEHEAESASSLFNRARITGEILSQAFSIRPSSKYSLRILTAFTNDSTESSLVDLLLWRIFILGNAETLFCDALWNHG